MTPKEAAERLSEVGDPIATSVIHYHIREGHLKATKEGRGYFIDPDDLEEFKKAREGGKYSPGWLSKPRERSSNPDSLRQRGKKTHLYMPESYDKLIEFGIAGENGLDADFRLALLKRAAELSKKGVSNDEILGKLS